jgi:hypothetical protein
MMIDRIHADQSVGFLYVVMSLIGYGGSVVTPFIELWRLRCIDRHPDLIALTRYGPLSELIPEIEREVASKQDVVAIGKTLRTFFPITPSMAALNLTQVMLTRSWLIHFRGEGGHRMSFLRLNSIIVAHRPVHPTTGQPINRIVLMDRCGARVDVYGKSSDLTRLLVNLLPRIPWALTHFGTEQERAWQENRGLFIASIDQRREQFRGNDAEITR